MVEALLFRKNNRLLYEKGGTHMKYVKSILSAIVVFIFGLTVGGLGVWYIIMSAFKETKYTHRADRDHVSYADHYE